MGNTFSPKLGDRGASDRCLSSKVWRNISTDLAGSAPDDSFFFFRDYQTLLANEFTATQATAGTFDIGTPNANVGFVGEAQLDCNSTTAAQGIQVQYHDTAIVPNSGVLVAFEARLKAMDIATGPEFFCGLSIVDSTIIASSANSSTDHIGFESVSDDGVLLFHTEDGGTRVSGATSPHTLVDGATTTDGTEWVKLGFRIETDLSVNVYVDGVLTDVAFTTTPDIAVGSLLVPSFVCQSGGTTDPVVHLDWFGVGGRYFDIST